MIRVRGIADLKREVFGPVLHLATFEADELPMVVATINATGYGLTFGLHTRIDNRVDEITRAIRAGNIYVNRNQIGAVVGSQPFGGEGLSGTGPKAGGPDYLTRFTAPVPVEATEAPAATAVKSIWIQKALGRFRESEPMARRDLPGPTGETNRLSFYRRAPLVCLGPDTAAQARAVRDLGGSAVEAPGIEPSDLLTLEGFSGVLWWGGDAKGRAYVLALAQRRGPILPLITALPDRAHVAHERHVCVDTTASGGNAALLAEAGSA